MLFVPSCALFLHASSRSMRRYAVFFVDSILVWAVRYLGWCVHYCVKSCCRICGVFQLYMWSHLCRVWWVTHMFVCILRSYLINLKLNNIPLIPWSPSPLFLLSKAATELEMNSCSTHLSLFSFSWVRSLARMLIVTLPCLFITVSPFLEERNSGGHSAWIGAWASAFSI